MILRLRARLSYFNGLIFVLLATGVLGIFTYAQAAGSTPVASGTPMAQDTFATRTVASGWGTASDGNIWTVGGGTASNFSVSGNEGHLKGNQVAFQTLGTQTASDEEAVMRFSTANVNADDGRLVLRATGTSYYHAGLSSPSNKPEVDIFKTTNGTDAKVASVSITITNNTFYWIRARVQTSGSTAILSVRTWKDGTTEPTTWNSTYTDNSPLGAGKVGIRGYDANKGWNVDHFSAGNLASSSDTTPPTVSLTAPVNNATVSGIVSLTAAASDNVAVARVDFAVDGNVLNSDTTSPYAYNWDSTTVGNTAHTISATAYDTSGNPSTPSTATVTVNNPLPPNDPCAMTTTAPAITHVIWIVFENEDASSVIGSSQAPYTTSLANQCGNATNMSAEDHPSLPNYLAMTSGSEQGAATVGDGDPSPSDSNDINHNGKFSAPITADNIFNELGAHGLTWKSLEEDMPSACYQDDSSVGSGALYVVHHNPAAYFSDLGGTTAGSACSTNDIPLAEGATPDISSSFTFITPNINDDGHNTGVQGGDTWLSTFLPKILNSSQYATSKNTAIFITWDESSSTSPNIVPTVVISPYTQAGAVNTAFNHYTMLRATEEILGLPAPYLGNAAPAADGMTQAFNLMSAVVQPTTPTNVSATAPDPTHVNISWTASTDAGGPGVAGYNIFRNGSPTPIGTSPTTSYTDATVTPGTTYTYTVQAYDSATPPQLSAQSSPPASVTTPTNPDTIAPTVSLTSPANGANVSGTVTVTSTAGDNVAVTGVDIYDGTTKLGSATLASGTSQSGTWQFSWNTATATVGSHSLTAKATDGTNTTQSSPATSVTVLDTSPPTNVTVTSPTANQTVSGTISLTATAQDNVGVTSFSFVVDALAPIVVNSGSPASTPFNTTTLADGTHSVKVTASDAAGNSTTSSSVSFTIQNNAPAFPIATGTIMAQDTFASRTVASGWGTASDGNVWTLGSGNNSSWFSVSNNEAHMTGARVGYQTLGTQTTTEEEGVMRFATNNVNDDDGRIVLRATNGSYYSAGLGSPSSAPEVDIFKTVSGSDTKEASTPMSTVNGTYYWIRARVQTSGTTAVISVRVWKDGTAEPSTWSLTYTDNSPLGAGTVGMRGYDGGTEGWSADHFSAGILN